MYVLNSDQFLDSFLFCHVMLWNFLLQIKKDFFDLPNIVFSLSLEGKEMVAFLFDHPPFLIPSYTQTYAALKHMVVVLYSLSL